MLAGESHFDQFLNKYPEELHPQLKQDMRELIRHDRRFLQSQLQMMAAAYHCGSDDFESFRNNMDRLFLENPGTDPDA